MEPRSCYHPPAHGNNNYVKCDETAKKRDELVTGAVFRAEKAGRENTALTETCALTPRVTGAFFDRKKRAQRGHGRREKIALTEAPRRGGRRVAGLRFRSSLLYEGCSYILLG